MTKPQKIEKLLFVLAIAFCGSYKVGISKDIEKPIPKKAHGRPSKSLFCLGLDCFRALILFIEKEIKEFRKIIKLIKTCVLDAYDAS